MHNFQVEMVERLLFDNKAFSKLFNFFSDRCSFSLKFPVRVELVYNATLPLQCVAIDGFVGIQTRFERVFSEILDATTIKPTFFFSQ